MASTYQLALDGEWDKLKNLYDDENVFALLFPQTAAGDTAFHLAVFSKSKEPLQSFINNAKGNPVTAYDYWAKNIYGNTALHEAAADGNIEAVKLLVEHDKELLEDRNKEGETPLFKAASYGQKEVVLALRSGSRESCTNLEDIHRYRLKPDTNEPGASILHAAIQGEHFEMALELLKLDESLATLEDEDGMTSLQLLATMPSAFRSRYRMSIWKRLFYFCPLIQRTGLPILRRILKDKRKHKLAFELTETLVEQDILWQRIIEKRLSEDFLELGNVQPTEAGEGEGSKPISKPVALFLATERGVVEIVNEILKRSPQLVEHVDDKYQNMLHIAIMHR
ncbi:hypothetical protein Patl1_09863 [Pistacia atlantica]|uniref:Uncharacterized protein n=1 Tax=Pistacia atlantica TaxID=434234 RepID=A0ACC1A5N8_9ROSI|nr:hypothetical protein Patl1_09863 [Pistacia atlantica]